MPLVHAKPDSVSVPPQGPQQPFPRKPFLGTYIRRVADFTDFFILPLNTH